MRSTLKNILILFLMGSVIFLIGSMLGGGLQFESSKELITKFGFYQLYTFVLGISNMLFFNYLESRSWEDDQRAQRIATGILGSIGISMGGIFLLRLATAVFLSGKSLESFLLGERMGNYVFGLVVTITIVIIFHLIYFYNQHQKRKVKESQIVAKTESARFESLKNQLDPHFLFNSLNVLTSLIGENPAQAEIFTTKLSKVYRYVLEQKGKDLVSLEEELRFARSYMELLQMRFEEALEFSIPDAVSDTELKVVPLSLQLLLENAVKHNVITISAPLRIRIFEEQEALVVENSLNPKATLEKSTKVGLQNIRQRYALLTDRQIKIEKSEQAFRVVLPLLTQKTKTMKTDFIFENEKYQRAKRRVDDLKEFYGSLMAYALVIPFLVFVNYQTFWGFKWFWFPAIGWGIGLIVHAFKVFGYGAGWEERKIRELMEKDR